MSHAAAKIPKVAAETPFPDQGETETRPRPAPRANRAREKAEATKAPANMAAQETPEIADSALLPLREETIVSDIPPSVIEINLSKTGKPTISGKTAPE